MVGKTEGRLTIHLLVLNLLCFRNHANKADNGCKIQSMAPHFKVFLMSSPVEQGISSSDESAVELKCLSIHATSIYQHKYIFVRTIFYVLS